MSCERSFFFSRGELGTQNTFVRPNTFRITVDERYDHMNTQNDSSLLLGFTFVSLWDPLLLSFSFDGHASFFWPYCPLAFVSQLC